MNNWILVIDDDNSNLKMASRILSQEKMRVSCIKSGMSAIEFLKENKPDLILLDVHMPGMDGFDTIAAGDSFNDLGMIKASRAGFLFRTTDQIKKDYPELKAFETYDEFLAAIKEVLE